MLHSNVAELRLLLDTFTRVWSSGGQANLSLQTKDSQMWAQLGPAGGRRPGAPEAGGRGGAEPRNHQAELHPPPPPRLLPARRKKGPSARARDLNRRQEWLARQQEPAVELPASQPAQKLDPVESRSNTEQEVQEFLDPATGILSAEESLGEIMNMLDVIPQLDGPAEIKLGESPPEKTPEKKEDEPVMFQMLDTGKVETKLLAPGETPPPKVHHPEFGIGTDPKQTKWCKRIGVLYDFGTHETGPFRREMYQVK